MDKPELYWHLELYSGEIIKVKPDPQKIQQIQKMIADQEGAITTPTRSIIIKDVRDFRISDELFTDQKLLEDSARAFKEPMYTEIKENSITYSAVVHRYVKKQVPRRKWESYYSKIPSYRLLHEDDSFITMAFSVAAHEIDWSRVHALDQDEERQLSRRIEN